MMTDDKLERQKKLRGKKKIRAIKAENTKAKVMDLALQGYSATEIGKALGLTHSGVKHHLDGMLAEAAQRHREDTDSFRELVRRRNEALLRIVWQQQFVPEEATPEERKLGLEASALCLRINDSTAKLLGLNMPPINRLEVSGPNGGPIDVATQIQAAIARAVEVKPEDYYPTLDAEVSASSDDRAIAPVDSDTHLLSDGGQ